MSFSKIGVEQKPEAESGYTPHTPQADKSNPQSIAVSSVVYFSNSFDLEVRLQSEDRAHRIGQTKSVTYVDLMVPKTVDEKIVKALRGKIDIANEDLPEGRRYIYGEQKLPSVTTILSATKKDKGALDAWVARVGQEEADRIKNEASRVGTYLHEVIERMVAYRHLPRPTNWEMCKGYEMGYKIINTYFRNVNEIWGSEVSLYYPEKYAGTTDLVGVYRDKPAIIDFKQ
eukprot:gene13865-12486_t